MCFNALARSKSADMPNEMAYSPAMLSFQVACGDVRALRPKPVGPGKWPFPAHRDRSPNPFKADTYRSPAARRSGWQNHDDGGKPTCNGAQTHHVFLVRGWVQLVGTFGSVRAESATDVAQVSK